MTLHMDASGSHDANRQYYDAFSADYERERGRNDPGGYHELLDELEAGYVRRFGQGRDVLEVGCGTGLVLLRLREFARQARGVDLSPGMLEKARQRGLDVTLGSATELPFADNQFDVTCSFKVLAHVPDIEKALAEMARVTRPGGMVLAEFYNPFSLRGLAKRLGPAGKIADGANEHDVYTRFDSPRRARQLTPPGCVLVGARGVRITIPSARLMKNPLGRWLFRAAEHALCDSPLKRLAGFYVAAYEKRG
ncbi:MAG TPA: methyltransferase domain-containing protein [Polyangiaceae bacterium]|nr:methyltransferase domain-containing protein [Polyangiaceae bacterium]